MSAYGQNTPESLGPDSPPVDVDRTATEIPADDSGPHVRSGNPRSETVAAASPPPRRRRIRSATFKTISDYDEYVEATRAGWKPGSEPGFDPKEPQGDHSMPELSAPCEITVVDFSQTSIDINRFDNQGLIDFLPKPLKKWVKCRWINVNGLSQDVIQAIGFHLNLHKLALEDILEQHNRTKADWYSNHVFIVLTLQKLVEMVEPDSDSDSDDYGAHTRPLGSRSEMNKAKRRLKRLFRRKHHTRDLEKRGLHHGGDRNVDICHAPEALTTTSVRTLQRYQASSNEARIEFMERHSSLIEKGRAILAEQVAIFLTSDNTAITFFEISAADIERPILKRLSTPGTILRQSCDASLLVQAVIDAIIDLAIPLTAVYNDVLGDIELDVLTNPDISQSKRLYIIISEINKMLSFLNPIDNLVNVLRDHRTQLKHDEAVQLLQDIVSGVIITPVTHIYLGDVLDHCIIVIEALQQIRKSADNLTDLIFNTTSAQQNETMKTLTLITVIFLPLTFITGFFGQNFAEFPETKGSVRYFWICAIPTMIFTITLIMFGQIKRKVTSLLQKRHILSVRRSKKGKDKDRMGGNRS